MRRRGGDGAQVAAETEVADRRDVGAVLVPDDVQRGAGTELPAHDGAAADAAEVEVGIGRPAACTAEVARPRRDERVVVVIVAGGDERLQIELEGEPRAERPVGARAQLERALLEVAEDVAPAERLRRRRVVERPSRTAV